MASDISRTIIATPLHNGLLIDVCLCDLATVVRPNPGLHLNGTFALTQLDNPCTIHSWVISKVRAIGAKPSFLAVHQADALVLSVEIVVVVVPASHCQNVTVGLRVLEERPIFPCA